MAKGIERLSGTHVSNSRPGVICDGGGLWLQTTESKDGKDRNRSWIFRYTVAGRTRHMGLGSYITVSLKDAREAALQCRKQLLAGIDPIEQRNAERSAKIAESAKMITFEAAALAYIAAHRNEWRSQEHAAQWPASLRRYVHPIIGKMPVAQIDTPLLLKTLQPIWATIPETASRIRQRIEAILDWATASGYRGGDNPARWQGHLEYLLAKPSKRRVEHFAALPWREMPNFMTKLRAVVGVVPRALEFTILIAARRDEARLARWDELDLEQAIWTVPASRMKGGKEHRVPLSDRALAILREMQALRCNDYVFPGEKGGATHKEGTRMLLKTLAPGVTVHGFRSSFRDWAGEQTSFPREVCEAALAHSVGNAVERSYRRGDALEHRRRLMEAWDRFVSEPLPAGATVTPLRSSVR
jgi:integrase